MGSLLIVLGVSGCGTDVWENYATPQYGRERADILCHPYSDCSPGTWVPKAGVSENIKATYERCEVEALRRNHEWSSELVSLGIDINRCMSEKGYRLVRE